MKVAIITSGYLPVPPTKGGAVENIIYNLLKKNEIYGDCYFTVYSIYSDNHEIFKNTNIEYVKVSALSKLMDYTLYFVAKNIFKKEHLISYRYFFQRMEFLRIVGKRINKCSYDKVILENNIVMFRAFTYGNNFEKYKGKIYYHAHNELGKTLGYDRYLCKLKKIIGVSDYITEQYKNYLTVTDVNCETIYNVIDESVFTKELSSEEVITLKGKLGIDNGNPVLLFTGRMSEEKGILELLQALSSLETNQYNLLIVGKSFYGTRVEDKFERNLRTIAKKVKGNVIFTGLINYKDMYKYYKVADLCILPSVWNEPCALTVIECIVSGTPLITTNTGGIPEIITNSTILLNTERLVESLAISIGTLLNSPAKLNELKEKSRLEVYKHGSLDDYYHNFVNSLKS